jgi:DNA repair exonuclease SbcCD nuclease subunit
MTLNVLCIGDIHIQTSNTVDIRIFIKKLLDYIEIHNEKIDFIILMGDILHTHERLHTIPFNIANELFEKLSLLKPLYVLVGNHDYINNSQFLSDNHWMNCFKNKDNIHIIDKVTLYNNNNINIIMSPYVPDGRFIEALNTTLNFDWKQSNCIFGHQLLDGVKMGAILTENVEKWEETYPYLISGHIHDKQKVQNNLYYTGSSMQHAFGESYDKTISLVKINTNSNKIINIEEIDLNLPKKQILYYDIEDLDINKSLNENENILKKLINMIENSKQNNIHYKITISGSFEQYKVFKTKPVFLKLQQNDTKVVFKNKLVDILNKKKLFDETKISQKFKNVELKDILYNLIINDDSNKLNYKLNNIYNSFYNSSELYNNKFIELVD